MVASNTWMAPGTAVRERPELVEKIGSIGERPKS